MEKYRIVQFKNGEYQIQSYETIFIFNPFRRWKDVFSYNSGLEGMMAHFNELVKSRDKELGRFVSTIVKTEEA